MSLLRRGVSPEAQRRRSEAGDTLIELLVALVIISIAVVGLIGGLAAEIGSSGGHRNVTNLDGIVQSFAESIRASVQLTPAMGTGGGGNPLYAPCATTYLVASQPYPATGPSGTATSGMAVTVFGAGFTAPSGSTDVTVGGKAALSVSATQSDATHGNVTFNFVIPSTAPTGPDAIVVTYNGQSATAPVPFKVDNSLQAINPSPLATYKMGITSIQYGQGSGNGRVSGFSSSCNSETDSLSSDIQQIQVTGTAPTGTDVANIVVTNSTPSKYAPSVQVNGSETGASLGSTISFNATLTGNAAWTTPSWSSSSTQGRLSFVVVGPTPDKSTLCPGGGLTVAPGAITASGSCSFVALALGNYTATAIYTGDSDYDLVAGTSASSQAISTKATPSVTVSASPASPAYGQSITFTATVTATAPLFPPPTGKVNWSGVNCANAGSTTLTTVTPATTPASATATCQITSPTPGITYAASATYQGDSNYGMASSNSVSVTSPKLVPNASVVGAPFGTALKFTATITAPNSGSPQPGGSITSWSGVTCDGQTSLAAVPGASPPAATATCTINSPAPGQTYTATANYSGDGNYASATPQGAYSVSALNPNVTLTARQQGTNSVIFTATASAPATGNPTPGGTVSWSGVTCTSSAPMAPASPATSPPSAEATCEVDGAVSGRTYSAMANYSGDSTYNGGSASTNASLHTVSGSNATLTGSVGTGNQSKVITWVYTVTGSGSTTPKGTVTWTAATAGSGAAPTCSATSSTLSSGIGAGKATTSITCTMPNQHNNITYSISASWPGDSNYAAPTPNPASQSVTG